MSAEFKVDGILSVLVIRLLTCYIFRGQSLARLHFMEPRLIWINLLVKLGVAAAVSSSLVRSKEFKSLLFREDRTFPQKVYLVLWMALPIMIGVWIRFSAKSFLAEI